MRTVLYESPTGAPEYGSRDAAGADLRAANDGELRPMERQLVDTGLRIAMPSGYYGRVAPRSGLAVRWGIDVLAGVIDADYRGTIGVCLINLGEERFVWRAGDRIAQLIIEPCERVQFAPHGLRDSERGAGGFGSTGIG